MRIFGFLYDFPCYFLVSRNALMQVVLRTNVYTQTSDKILGCGTSSFVSSSTRVYRHFSHRIFTFSCFDCHARMPPAGLAQSAGDIGVPERRYGVIHCNILDIPMNSDIVVAIGKAYFDEPQTESSDEGM